MNRITRRPPRAGFTLIELLVVIAIMGLLTALVVAGVAKVRQSQQTKVTDETLAKLQKGLDQQWKAVIDQAKQDRLQRKIPDAVKTLCDGDEDRAEALWTYMRLRREFPQTFAEAQSDVSITATVNNQAVTAYLARSQTYKSATGSAGGVDNESAVLLFMNLSESGRRGMNFSAADLAQGNLSGTSFTVFKDAWGGPIAFRRHANYAELQGPPFAPPSVFKDPMDPKGVLATGNWSGKSAAQTALGVTFGQSKAITAISLGPNKQFEDNPTGTTDDQFGYRVVRLGRGGD